MGRLKFTVYKLFMIEAYDTETEEYEDLETSLRPTKMFESDDLKRVAEFIEEHGSERFDNKTEVLADLEDALKWHGLEP